MRYNLAAVGYWHYGWQSPAPDIERFRRARTRVNPGPGNDPYLRHRLKQDKSKLPEGAAAVPMARRRDGVLKFGSSSGIPCYRATCAMIRDCLEKFEPVRSPYRLVDNSCRVGIADAYMSCCLKRRGPG